MLAGGLDPAYRAILAGPHELYTRVEVWANGVRIDPFGDTRNNGSSGSSLIRAGVPINQSGNSISATLTSRVARVCSLTLDRTLFPKDPSDLLAPFGNYLKIFHGVYSGDGKYVWPCFYGRINDCTLNDAGTFSLSAVDRAGDVQDAYFGHPTQSETGSLIGQQYRTLIRGALPDATFGAFDDGQYVTVPNLMWENDRASACDSLAQLGNMFWYPLANGEFVLRQVAWTKSQQPLMTFIDGKGGTMLNWSVSYSRTNVANSIIVSGELADGSTPVYATAQDLDPTSPTYIYGKYGIKTQFVSVQGAVTQGQAQTLANAYLKATKALSDTWTMQIPSDASIELGDPFLLQTTNPVRKSSTQVVSSFTMSLDSKDTMNVNLRAQVPAQFDVSNS